MSAASPPRPLDRVRGPLRRVGGAEQTDQVLACRLPTQERLSVITDSITRVSPDAQRRDAGLEVELPPPPERRTRWPFSAAELP
jgi:hypothetical protein